jgi:hypothetical protein
MALPWSIDASAGGELPVGRTGTPPPLQALAYPKLVVDRDPFVPEGETIAAGGAADSSVPLVRAVVLGDAPKALIETAGRPEFVGIGSIVAGSVVTAITRDGVVLDSGVRLSFGAALP